MAPGGITRIVVSAALLVVPALVYAQPSSNPARSPAVPKVAEPKTSVTAKPKPKPKPKPAFGPDYLARVEARRKAFQRFEAQIVARVKRVTATSVWGKKLNRVVRDMLAADSWLRTRLYADARKRLLLGREKVIVELIALRNQVYKDKQADAKKRLRVTELLAQFHGDNLRSTRWRYSGAAVRHRRAATALWKHAYKTFKNHQRRPTFMLRIAELFEMTQARHARVLYQALMCWNRPQARGVAEKLIDAKRDTYGRVKTSFLERTLTANYDDCEPAKVFDGKVTEAWVDLARLHRRFGDHARAAAAYEIAAEDTDAAKYLSHLEALAEAYINGSEPIGAIAAYDRLIKRLDQMKLPPKAMVAARHRFLTSIADVIALIWRGSPVDQANASLSLIKIYYPRRRNNEPHVHEVYAKLARKLQNLGAYKQAVPVLRYALRSWPRHAAAPWFHHQLVELLGAKGDRDGADRERALLLKRFSKGAAWYKANASNKVVLARVRGLISNVLYTLGRNLHRNARLLPSKAKRKPIFAVAAQRFAKFLELSPKDTRAIHAGYMLAQALGGSGKDLEAARRMMWVRTKGGPDGVYFEETTKQIARLYGEALEQRMKAKTLVVPKNPSNKALVAMIKAGDKPMPVPALVTEVLGVMLKLNDSVIEPERRAHTVLELSSVYLRFKQIAKAEQSLKQLLRKHCQTRAAKKAKDLLDTIYLARGNRIAQTELKSDYKRQRCGSGASVVAQRRKALEADFTRARALLNAGKHIAAAELLKKVVRATPYGKPMRAEAAYAASVAYRRAGWLNEAFNQLGRAAGTLKKPTKFTAQALWDGARLRQRTGNYKEAVDLLLKVHDLSKRSNVPTTPRFNLLTRGREALLRAAKLSEADGAYLDRGKNDPGAASLFLRYATEVKADAKAASIAQVDAVRCYRKAGEVKKMIGVFKEWKQTLRPRFNGWAQALGFNYEIAKALDAAGDRRRASRYFIAAKQLGKLVKSRTANAELVAEATFWLMANQYERAKKSSKFRWRVIKDHKDLQRQITPLEKRLRALRTDERRIGNLSTKWGLAASVVLADARVDFANTLLKAPLTEAFKASLLKSKSLNSVDKFVAALDRLEKRTISYAVGRWQNVARLAQYYKIDNKWTRRASERLALYRNNVTRTPGGNELFVREERPW